MEEKQKINKGRRKQTTKKNSDITQRKNMTVG